VPLGVFAARRPRAGQVVLAIAGIFQTIPSLALLVFMIPISGSARRRRSSRCPLQPAADRAQHLHRPSRTSRFRRASRQRRWVCPPRRGCVSSELPMASPSILAGIKTSAVINVGTATLGALIGAGGYGQLILTGIRLADNARILEGAVPAALLALGRPGSVRDRRAGRRAARAASV
jgi:osmoprotectant transport system permease protein